MERYFYKCKLAFKSIAAFALLFWALLFTSPVNAAPIEVNTLPNVAPIQLAYYGGHYHRWHRWHHGYRWNRWHRGHHWHRWHHWRR